MSLPGLALAPRDLDFDDDAVLPILENLNAELMAAQTPTVEELLRHLPPSLYGCQLRFLESAEPAAPPPPPPLPSPIEALASSAVVGTLVGSVIGSRARVRGRGLTRSLTGDSVGFEPPSSPGRTGSNESPGLSVAKSPTNYWKAPTDPTEAPTDPTEARTDPTEAIKDPTEAPTDPTEAPMDPTEAPMDPADAPTGPTEAPTDPTEAPTDPAEPPTDPAEPPTDPAEPPTDPAEAPTDPTEAPTDLAEAPTDPTEAPTDPAEAPTDPAEAPTDPAEAPTDLGRILLSGLCPTVISDFLRDFESDRRGRCVDPDGLYAIVRTYSPGGIVAAASQRAPAAGQDEGGNPQLEVAMPGHSLADAVDWLTGLVLPCDCTVTCTRVAAKD